jgi:hypothetical protein
MIHIGLSREETQRVVDLIAELDAAQGQNNANLRAAPRLDFCHPMWLNIPGEPGQPWVHVFSRNLSSGGLSFLARRSFVPESCLILAHTLDTDGPQLALGAVRFCRQITRTIFEIGVEFLARVEDTDMRRQIPDRWYGIIDRQNVTARLSHPTAPAIKTVQDALPADVLAP